MSPCNATLSNSKQHIIWCNRQIFNLYKLIENYETTIGEFIKIVVTHAPPLDNNVPMQCNLIVSNILYGVNARFSDDELIENYETTIGEFVNEF